MIKRTFDRMFAVLLAVVLVATAGAGAIGLEPREFTVAEGATQLVSGEIRAHNVNIDGVLRAIEGDLTIYAEIVHVGANGVLAGAVGLTGADGFGLDARGADGADGG